MFDKTRESANSASIGQGGLLPVTLGMTTNKDRQAVFKAKMRAAGMKQMTVWVTEEQAIALKEWLAKGGDTKDLPLHVITSNDLRLKETLQPSLPEKEDRILSEIARWPDYGIEGILALMEIQQVNPVLKDAEKDLTHERMEQTLRATLDLLAREVQKQSEKTGDDVEHLIAGLRDRYLKICRSGKWKTLAAKIARGRQ